jgi:hypothetical protein
VPRPPESRWSSGDRVELGQEAPYAQLLVSVDDAEGTVAAIRGATGL